MNFLKLMMAVLFFCNLAMFSCHTPLASQQSDGQEEKLKTLAQNKFGDEYELHYNKEQSVVAVCKSFKKHAQDPMSEVQVLIYKTSDLSLQAEEVIVNCSKYFWKGNKFVVVEVPGIIGAGKKQSSKERILYPTN